MQKKETLGEISRFVIVGTISTAVNYAIYWVLQHWINVNIAYTIGYGLSFLLNYYLSAHFTFHEKTSAKNGIGFSGAHLVNYLMHMVLLNFFIWLGLSNELAPFAVLAIAVPTNFILVRFVFKHFKRRTTCLLLACMLTPMAAMAQDRPTTAEEALAELDSPTFVPTVKVGKVLHEGDSIQYMEMNNVYVYPQLTFKNRRQAQSYMRLVKNVKKVLPIAKEARQILIETTEYLETLPNDKAKEEHMKRVEDDIFKTYKPKMKKLTYSQGKLLIKLIDRECNSSSYEVIKAFMGPFRAGFWQVFAWGFGASLKKGYDAEGVDRLTERVVLMVEAGQI